MKNIKETKQKQEKKEKIKRKIIKVINVCSYVLAILFILTCIVSCSMKGTNKDNNNDFSIDSDNNIQLAQRDNAFNDNEDYYITAQDSNEGYGYIFSEDTTNLILAVQFWFDDFVIDNYDLDIFLIPNPSISTLVYNVKYITFIFGPDTYELALQVWDSSIDEYVLDTMVLSIDELLNILKGSIIIFNKPMQYNKYLSNSLDKMVYFNNLDYTLKFGNSDFYYNDVKFALKGAFSLKSDFETISYNKSGTLIYNDPTSNELEFNFYGFQYSYENGLRFLGNSNFLNPYYANSGDLARYFNLRNANVDYLTYITNIILMRSELDLMNDLFQNTIIRDTFDFRLGDLFYSQRTTVSTIDYERDYFFNFISNNTSFNKMTIKYDYQDSTTFKWSYIVTYDNTMDNISPLIVLDVTGFPRLSSSVGGATGVNYNFDIALTEYQIFTIYDFYNADIQTFISQEVYYGSLFLPPTDEENMATLSDAFDIITLALTSLLPFLNFMIFPNITIATFVLIPLVISLLIFVFKMFKR